MAIILPDGTSDQKIGKKNQIWRNPDKDLLKNLKIVRIRFNKFG